MKIFNRSIFVIAMLILFGCSEEEFDEYYGRPDDLEEPIYQILEERGNFKSLLTTIDKAGYKDVLGRSGYWTMFAPNDQAFSNFLQQEGISNIESIDSILAGKIVRYALVYNAFRTDRLSDYQSDAGWEEDMAFRRRTAYYDGFTQQTVDGQQRIVVSSNRNNAEGADYYIPGDNNNKYLSYFVDEFMQAQNLGAYDYNFFFPDESYTGFNVLRSNVETENIVAENGIIHEVDKVSLPLINLDQKLVTDDNYSLFYSILEDNLVSYVFDDDATIAYQNYSRSTEDVYVKVYDPALSFSPNNENYLKEADNDGQSNGYTIFAPQNDVFQQFIDDVLLKNYSSLDALPKYIFEDFYNAHMVQNAVWPSIVESYNNELDEELRFDLSTDIEEAEVLSNGFFYGTNKIQESNLFFSVYTSAYLDPEFTLATRLFNDGSGYREIASNINNRYTLFLPSDDVLRNLGYDYNINRSEWVYTSPITGNTVVGTIARTRLMRILYNGIIPTPNDELNNLSGTGIIRSGDLDLPGEYIKWENNTVFAAGNEVLENRVNIIGYEDQRNGRTYYIDNLLEFSEEPPGLDIQRLAEDPESPFTNFYNYLSNSSIYDPNSGNIQGLQIGTSYTFVIPNNEAIIQAVTNGELPSDPETGDPNFTPSDQIEIDQVADFIRYHILATRTISDDGLTGGQIETLLQDELGEKTYISILNSPGELIFIDSARREANYIPSQSNNLADRSLIHLIDNYLLYTE